MDRQSRFVLLVRVPGKDAITVVQALSTAVRALPAGLMLMASLTWDRGTELAAHKTFTVATKRPGLLLRSAASVATWYDENTNGLLRRISRKARTSRPTRRLIWMASRNASTHAPGRPWAMPPPLIDWRPLLHRPVERTPAFLSISCHSAPGIVIARISYWARRERQSVVRTRRLRNTGCASPRVQRG